MPSNYLKYIGKLSVIGWLSVTCSLYSTAAWSAPAATQQEDQDEQAAPEADTAPQEKPGAKQDGQGKTASLGDYLAGRFAESQGDTGHGIQYLRDSLKRDPNNQDVLKSLYRMQVLSGEVGEAVPLAHKLEGVKVVDDGSEFLPEMLIALDDAKSGRYSDAEKQLAKVPKRGFNSLYVPLIHAWLKLGENDVKAPIDVKNLTSDTHVVLPHVYLNAAFINDLAGFDKEAQKQYEEAVKDPRIEPFRAVEALANFYARHGMEDKRRKLVDDYVSAHGDSYLADELLLQQPAEHPKPLVNNAVEGLAEVFYTIGNIFHGVRAPADEVATLHLALYLRPDYPAAQFLLASSYELAQDYQSAVDTYKSISSDSPYYTRGRIRAVYDEIELGHKDTALSALDAIARENPKEIDALLAKGDILRAQNHYKEAIGAYDAAIARIPDPQKRHWILYFSRGACYQLLDQWDKAEADMKKALALDPGEPEILNYLGYSWLTMRQNIAEARKMVEQAYEARPEDAHIIDSMGYAQYVGGDFASAEEYFDQALERTPNDPTVNDHLGDTYWQLGRKTEARYQWERALANNPDSDTEKGLRKKLKDGLALEHPLQSSVVKKSPKPVEDEQN